ncbi:hypothetical protein JOD64_005246 [Micromonospora luteifusca]|uniref:Uncharacterized protein n=1 Tax=Micromonospora luteifusca TaxID=709860 RepID=A0ABS2M0Q6_9ACTN|nr:hypothetical protein [Micromonospora luteifusca]MBM7494024.1 hypothetical protein [Micromonospora luteifusca]
MTSGRISSWGTRRHFGDDVKPLGRAKRDRKQIKINRRLRPDWAKLDKNTPLPVDPYPKQPDAPAMAA